MKSRMQLVLLHVIIFELKKDKKCNSYTNVIQFYKHIASCFAFELQLVVDSFCVFSSDPFSQKE